MYNELHATIVAIILLVCCFIIANERDTLQQEAVDKGFAEWIIKNKNSVEFKWKDSKNE
jgi:hypothetical protein